MLGKAYDALGSRVKNSGMLQRNIGFQLRKFVKYGNFHKRNRLKFSEIYFPDIALDRSVGYKMVNGLVDVKYTKEVIDIAKASLSKLDLSKLDFESKGKSHLYTGVFDDYKIDASSAILKFALQRKILEPIVSYFGFVPVLSHVGCWYSPSVANPLSSSQLFHCDQADVRQVKVFVHCSDVSVADGALHLINAEDSNLLRKRLGYKWSDDAQCISDSTVIEHLGSDSWTAQVGDEGTILFCDSSRCFHYGSRSTDHSRFRLVVMFQFLSPFAFTLPWKEEVALPFARLADSYADPIQKLVLGANN